MNQTKIQQIREIVEGFTTSSDTENLVNAYLAQGWLLLSVHARGSSNGSGQLQTVYVLGYPDTSTQHPVFKQSDAVDKRVSRSLPHLSRAFLWG